MDSISKKIKMGANTFDFSVASSTDETTLFRFGWNPRAGTSVAGLAMKIYSLQIYIDGELKGDFVPCKDSEGNVGLYNLCTATFCRNNSNAGSSEPTAGPESGSSIVTVSEDAEYTFTVDRDRELVAVFEEDVRLPIGYTELEYIGFDRNCGINTGFQGNFSTSRFVLDIRNVTALSANYSYYLAASGSFSTTAGTKYFNICSPTYTGVQYRDASGAKSVTIGTIRGYDLFMDVDFTRGIITLREQEFTLSTGNYGPTTPIYIGVYSPSSSSDSATFKLYSAQFYTGNKLERNLVPCINPSGVIGLYDLVYKTFHKNEYTGTLTAGPAV